MCIAAPAKVVEINREKESLFADFGGVRQEAKINLLPDVEIGDYVLIHAGYAIEKLSEEAAKESLEAWEELLEVLEEEDREMEKARMADLNQKIDTLFTPFIFKNSLIKSLSIGFSVITVRIGFSSSSLSSA